MEYLSLSDLFHLAECFQDSSVLLHMTGFPYFLMDELSPIVYTHTFSFFLPFLSALLEPSLW